MKNKILFACLFLSINSYAQTSSVSEIRKNNANFRNNQQQQNTKGINTQSSITNPNVPGINQSQINRPIKVSPQQNLIYSKPNADGTMTITSVPTPTFVAPKLAPAPVIDPKKYTNTPPPNFNPKVSNNTNTMNQTLIQCQNEVNSQRHLSRNNNRMNLVAQCLEEKTKLSVKYKEATYRCEQQPKNLQKTCIDNIMRNNTNTNQTQISNNVQQGNIKNQNNIVKQLSFCQEYLNKNLNGKKITAGQRSEWMNSCITAQNKPQVQTQSNQQINNQKTR